MTLDQGQTFPRSRFPILLLVAFILAASASLQSSYLQILKDGRSSLFSFHPSTFRKKLLSEEGEEREHEQGHFPQFNEEQFSTTTTPSSHPRIYDVPLDTNDTFHLYWKVDHESEKVRMEIHSRALSPDSWLAVGFSDRGEFPGSEFCVFWVDWKDNVHFQNVEVDDEGRFKVLDVQACLNFRYMLRKRILKFTFSRDFDPCTSTHYIIERGTTHIVWSWGKGPLYELEGVLAKGDYDGLVKVELLKPDLPQPDKNNARRLSVVANKVAVPAEETTYWCSVQKLPDEFIKKHHMIEFGPKIQKENEDIVHHMEVFHCEHPPDFQMPLYQGPCHSPNRKKEIDACKKVMAAWAMGASNFAYPDEAGLPIGGEDFNQFVMLEVHYNNPALIEGRIDSSGIELSYVSELRPFDSAIMELGLEYTPKMAIPPRMDSFILAGYCIPECTALSLPSQGIYMFGSQLHTHLTGVRAWTKHFRGDKELLEMNRDNHYSTHFQEIRRLPRPVHVLPGDALVMACEYSTPDRSNVTLGGFSITDEMCVNYVHYYPKVDLEVCKSSVDSKTLQDYFDFMHRLELQPTSPDFGWKENYEAIEWTPLRSSFLQSMYEEAPLSMQCNRSSGQRFPGFWENKPIPVVHQLLPNSKRSCEDKTNLEDLSRSTSNE